MSFVTIANRTPYAHLSENIFFNNSVYPPLSPDHAQRSARAIRGWAAVFDAMHQSYYYHNLETDETTWVLPTAVDTESDPAGPPAKSPPPERDEPPIQAKKNDASLGGADGEGTSRTGSQGRRASKKEGDGERADSRVARGKRGETTATKRPGTGDADSGAKSTSSKNRTPAAVVAAAGVAAAGEGDSASTQESLPRYGLLLYTCAGRTELRTPRDG